MAFLGRERELAQLAEAVRRVAEGRLGRVVLTGPAGIGCTRLLDELSKRVSSVPGVLACRGRAYEPAMGTPYQAVGDALAEAFERLPDKDVAEVVSSGAFDLSLLVPKLAERLDLLEVDRSAPEAAAPDQLGRRVVESILGALERLSQGGLVLLVLEDIHFADPATRGIIEALEGIGRRLPVCLVVTYQPDELHRRHPVRALAESLVHDPEVSHMELGPMPGKDIERLVVDATGERPPGNVMTAVTEGARGNPLIAVQLAQSAETLEGVRLSDPFDQICGARLEALPRDGARVVRVMAAARAPLARSTLLAIHPPEGRLTMKGLEEASQSGFVVGEGDSISISHELCAEAIEGLEVTPERHALHAALAERLHASPAVSAWHWVRAARPGEARDAHIRAATSALRLDPGDSVLLHYEQALELPGVEDVGTEERAAVLAGAAAASATAGRFRRAMALQRRAIESRATRDATRGRGRRDAATRLALGEMYAELGRYQWAGGELNGAIDSMERGLGIMPDSPSRSRARAQAVLAQHYMLEGRFEESRSIAEQAIATATAALAQGDSATAELGHATCTLGVDAAYLGDLPRGLTLLSEASQLARRAGRLDDLMRAAANRTTLLDLDTQREEALAAVQESLIDATAGGLGASYSAFLRNNAADILFELGRWEEAEVECRLALDWRMVRLEEWRQPLVLGLLLTESRADEEAASLVGQALLRLETVPAGQWTGQLLRAAVSLALWTGDPGSALGIAEREWPRALESGELVVIGSAASTCLEAAAAAADHGRAGSDAGLIARARALAEHVLPEAKREIESSSIGPELGARQEAELSLATARAHAQRIRGAMDQAVWDHLASEWERRGLPFKEAKARWWQALAVLEAAAEESREAARVDASGPLSRAYRIARDLPALPLLREIVDLGTRARVSLPLPSDSRERDALVAVGPGVSKPVAVGPGRPDPEAARSRDIARAIEERVIASLRGGSADSYGLSPREREVLNILAEGRTDRDIAARLFISQRTVHVHVRRILAKLGVSSRTEAAGVAIRQGLVSAQLPGSPSGSTGADDVASRS